jgi:hypothetical protein
LGLSVFFDIAVIDSVPVYLNIPQVTAAFKENTLSKLLLRKVEGVSRRFQSIVNKEQVLARSRCL